MHLHLCFALTYFCGAFDSIFSIAFWRIFYHWEVMSCLGGLCSVSAFLVSYLLSAKSRCSGNWQHLNKTLKMEHLSLFKITQTLAGSSQVTWYLICCVRFGHGNERRDSFIVDFAGGLIPGCFYVVESHLFISLCLAGWQILMAVAENVHFWG